MTSFVHVDQPTSHPGVARAEALFGQIQAVRAGEKSARPLIALFVVALIGAALVIADKLVSHWDESALFAAWAVFCVAAIGLFALYAGAMGKTNGGLAGAWRAASRRRASARADARFLETAKNDPRVMHELQAAMWRQQAEGRVPAADVAKIEARMPTLYEAMRRQNGSRYY